MIGKLYGVVDYIDLDHLVLNVNSVGYIVHCSASFLSRTVAGEKIELFIDSQTREDGTYLYGFENINLKKQFLVLITVKGVGPKLALSILSDMNVDDISRALATQDKSRFQSITGVGSKLAERILVELKGKNIQTNFSNNEDILSLGAGDNICQDAVSALVNLGISRSEAHNKITKILANHPDIKIDQLIAISLRQ
jgi:Holliday junction DNA helicase RuvA